MIRASVYRPNFGFRRLVAVLLLVSMVLVGRTWYSILSADAAPVVLSDEHMARWGDTVDSWCKGQAGYQRVDIRNCYDDFIEVNGTVNIRAGFVYKWPTGR